MEITEKKITIRDIVEGYDNDDEKGIRGYGGKLDIRPPYQREFIYSDKDKEAVIHSVLNNYPLNVMYWCKRAEDADVPYEILDGQQTVHRRCVNTLATDFLTISSISPISPLMSKIRSLIMS